MRKTRFILLITLLFFTSCALLLNFSCKHNPIFPKVCFESDILPIFLNNCTMSGCHNQVDAKEGIVLTNYENIMAAGIVAGNPNRSSVYNAITGGEDIMPPSGKMPDNLITFIRSWIESGAENTTGCSSGIIDTTHTANCDTTNVTYSATISSIFNLCCLNCHSSTSSIDFSTYTALSTYLSGNSQTLLNTINYVAGAQQMPPSYKLDACTIKKIQIWVTAGYPNN